MADSKITALTSIGTSTDPVLDQMVIVDVSDGSMAATGTTKKVSLNQLLATSPTATLASATITGDLTVDTSTLKVDSANNRVGIGTATPTDTLDVNGRVTAARFLSSSSSASLPALAVSAGNGVYNSGTNEVGFSVNSTLAMTLNSTGLGLGVTPSYKLDVSGDLAVNGNENYVYLFSTYSIGNNARVRFRAVGAGGGSGYGGDFRISTRAANNAWNTDVLVVDSSGNLLVGTTSQIRGGKLSVDSSAGVASGLKSSAGSSVFVEELWNTGSLDNSFINFGTDSTFTARGSITYNRSGGLVAYNTTSDYRAKDIIGPVSNSGSVIDSLKVYIGKMKGASVERPMLVAHEAQIVAPYSVTGQKDEVDADGNPKYQQMDVSSFVPLLIAEIQSLRTRVAALEA